MSSTSVIALVSMAVVALLVWAYRKYQESQAEKRSAELRQLYASVHSEPRRKAS